MCTSVGLADSGQPWGGSRGLPLFLGSDSNLLYLSRCLPGCQVPGAEASRERGVIVGTQHSACKHSLNLLFSHLQVSPLPGQKPSVLPFLKNKPLIFCPLGEGCHLAPEEWIREANCSLFSAHLLLEVPEAWEGSQCKSSCLYRPTGV